MPETGQPLPVILLVDDNEDDHFIIRRAFEKAGLRHRVQCVLSGTACMAYLSGDRPYDNREKFPLPALILLDIKMPPPDGFEVLKWIRERSEFSKVCVVMLTSSDEIRHAAIAYQLGANSFFVKPLDFGNASELSRSLQRLLAKCSSPAS